MPNQTKIELPKDDWLIPPEAVAAVDLLNKLADSQVEIVAPSQTGGGGGFQVASEDAKLLIPIMLDGPIANATSEADVVTKFNLLLAKLRKVRVLPSI